jgi:hypothetical protein
MTFLTIREPLQVMYSGLAILVLSIAVPSFAKS